MPSENSLRNLKPFQPGQSGNPGGRRKRVLSDRYSEMLESVLPEELRKPMKLPVGATWADAIAAQALRTALRSSEVGNAARKDVREACEGKSVQRVELGDHSGFEMRVTFELPLMKRVEAEKIIDVASDDLKPLSAPESEAG